MTPPRDNHPWTIRPGESPRAYQAFRTYMLMGPTRTHAKAAAAEGKSETLLGNWSSEHKWVERVSAYDSYVLSAEVDGYAEQLATVRSKHMAIMDRLLDHLEGNMALWKPNQVPPRDWTSALAVAVKSQQAALTLREDKTEGNGLLEDVLEKLERLEAEG